MKPHYETYRYVGEICRLQSQSIVECRLPGSEISSILAIHAKAVPTDCVCADGEVQYSGKVMLHVVYEDGERKICRAERGAEFFHKAEGVAVTPACFAKATLSAENVTYRREGSGLYLSVIVDATLTVYGNKQMEYCTGGEELIAQKAPLCVYKTLCISGETEGEDEFETEYLGDILLHSENAVVTRVTANAGQIEVEGELALNICVLNGDESVSSRERLLPFKMQIPSEEAFGNVRAGAKVQVRSSYLTVGADEEKGKSKIVFTYTLAAECYLCVKEEFSAVTDAFCCDREITFTQENEGGRYLTNHYKYVERVSGAAALSSSVDGEFFLQAAVLPRVEATCRKSEHGFEAEGAILADVLLKNAEGNYRSVQLSLPFVFPIDATGDAFEADGVVCGLNVRRKKNGETEAEATLKLCVRAYEEKTWTYISEVTEGEVYDVENSAFSVFLPKEGEDLWQVSKRLSCAPELLQKSNPDLEFPIKKGKKIFLYRQITENSQK